MVGARRDSRDDGDPASVLTTLPTREQVQERRRDLIHRLVHSAKGIGAADVIAYYVANPREWPKATWANARPGPPDYQQVNNHLSTLRREGKIEQAKPYGHYVSIVEPEAVERPMRKGADRAAQLKSEGKTGIQIAEIMEISRSMAYCLINDPYYENERERKKKYCPSCGKKKEPTLDWCRACKTGKAEDLLPPKDFLRFASRARREQDIDVIFGVTHDCVRVIRICTKRGIVEHKLGSYESWDDAVETLGLA